ncbi:hypothetical protein B296_00011060 [Ensete ventricosum]|uniref:Uncharacterized protein n=1 Tax=Ensete ventricosum TaxID=4639 RepID=A0A427A2Z3_ENSVE|nr:hypothetical protein B296_00011060 [Ensete ventricosum]
MYGTIEATATGSGSVSIGATMMVKEATTLMTEASIIVDEEEARQGGLVRLCSDEHSRCYRHREEINLHRLREVAAVVGATGVARRSSNDAVDGGSDNDEKRRKRTTARVR